MGDPVTRRACPTCGSDDAAVLVSLPASRIGDGNSTYVADYAERLGITRDDEYPIVRCGQCGFVFAQRDLSDAFLDALYGAVIDSAVAARESQSIAWVAHQLGMASSLLRAITKSPARVLDFGCGYGTVVRAIRSPEIDAIGFEPAEGPRNAARAEGLSVFDSVAEIEARAPFDAILLSDVLEHVRDPAETLALCHRLLADGGAICINVPDFSDARLRGIVAAAAAGQPYSRELNPWEHLNYFSPETLRRMVTAAGFVISRSLPSPGFGLRPEETGVRAVANTVKSVGRLVNFAFGGPIDVTTVVAYRSHGRGRE